MLRRRAKTIALLLVLGLVTTFVVATLLAIGVEARSGPQTVAERYQSDEAWTVTRWDRAGVMQIESVRTRGLEWSPGQVVGPPDTPTPGDKTTAWASASPDSGTEWLVLHYEKPVVPHELHVYESNAPGALFKVTIVQDDGREVEAWSGTDPVQQTTPVASVPVSKIPLSFATPAKTIKIYLASNKFPGWNEIDAVELIGADGSKQWVRGVEASSTYARSGRPASSGPSTGALVPSWSTLDRASPTFADGTSKYEQRLLDARGWPMVALSSETDSQANGTSSIPFVTGVGPMTFLSGSFAITTPSASGVRPPFPMRPIWSGVLVDTIVFAVAWWLIWITLTIPRRFVRDVARLRRGACIQCGYDLGFDFAPGCPECGWRRNERPTIRS